MGYIAVATLLAVCFSLGHGQNVNSIPLPAGSELILRTPYSAAFSCEGRKYGYYADQDNGCVVFHVCVPLEVEGGNIIETFQYSFFCANQTVFNQEHLTCDHPSEVDCSVANSLYSVNDNFFIVPPPPTS